jgi:hypothetical protein
VFLNDANMSNILVDDMEVHRGLLASGYESSKERRTDRCADRMQNKRKEARSIVSAVTAGTGSCRLRVSSVIVEVIGVGVNPLAGLVTYHRAEKVVGGVGHLVRKERSSSWRE